MTCLDKGDGPRRYLFCLCMLGIESLTSSDVHREDKRSIHMLQHFWHDNVVHCVCNVSIIPEVGRDVIEKASVTDMACF